MIHKSDNLSAGIGFTKAKGHLAGARGDVISSCCINRFVNLFKQDVIEKIKGRILCPEEVSYKGLYIIYGIL